MDSTRQLPTVLASLSSLVDRMWHGQLELPMPSGGTVHQALDRLMVMGGTYTHWFRGETAPQIVAPVVYGWVPSAAFRSVMDELAAAATEPSTSERVLTTPMGAVSGAELAAIVLSGALLTGRELEIVTGRRFDLPAEIVADVVADVPSEPALA